MKGVLDRGIRSLGGEWVPKVGKKMRTSEERNIRNGKPRILKESSLILLKLLRIRLGVESECV